MEGAVFIGFRGFKGGVAGYAHSRKIKFPAPPSVCSFTHFPHCAWRDPSSDGQVPCFGAENVARLGSGPLVLPRDALRWRTSSSAQPAWTRFQAGPQSSESFSALGIEERFCGLWYRIGSSRVVLCRPPNRNKADLDSLIQGARDPAQHCQGVALVIGVLKPADDRRRRANESGKLSLGEARRGPQFVDLAGDLLVRARLLKVLQPGRLACIEPAMKDLHCVDGGFRSLSHVKPPGMCAWADLPQTASCAPERDRSPSAGPPVLSQVRARLRLRSPRGRSTVSGD